MPPDGTTVGLCCGLSVLHGLGLPFCVKHCSAGGGGPLPVAPGVGMAELHGSSGPPVHWAPMVCVAVTVIAPVGTRSPLGPRDVPSTSPGVIDAPSCGSTRG